LAFSPWLCTCSRIDHTRATGQAITTVLVAMVLSALSNTIGMLARERETIIGLSVFVDEEVTDALRQAYAENQ
jgi:hypothetical protein